jgi:hypothetical protein
MSENQVAAGFDLGLLPDGNVLIEFFGDDGKTVNTQVVSPDLIKKMPTVVQAMADTLAAQPSKP